MPEAKRVLFLCTGNSCRSQMAEGLVNHDFGGLIEAVSAGTDPQGLDPLAVRVMAELGIDISEQRSEHVGRYEGENFDYVISLCADADRRCPAFFAQARRFHIGFADPPQATGKEAEIVSVYRRVRDEIRNTMREFFEKELSI